MTKLQSTSPTVDPRTRLASTAQRLETPSFERPEGPTGELGHGLPPGGPTNDVFENPGELGLAKHLGARLGLTPAASLLRPPHSAPPKGGPEGPTGQLPGQGSGATLPDGSDFAHFAPPTSAGLLGMGLGSDLYTPSLEIPGQGLISARKPDPEGEPSSTGKSKTVKPGPGGATESKDGKDPDTGLPYLPPPASDDDTLFGPEETPSTDNPKDESEHGGASASPSPGGARPSNSGKSNDSSGQATSSGKNETVIPDPAKTEKKGAKESLHDIGEDLSEKYQRKTSIDDAEDQIERGQQHLRTGGSAKYETGPEGSQGTVTEADVRGRLGSDPLIRLFGDEGTVEGEQRELPGNLVFDAAQTAEPAPDGSGVRPPVRGDIDVVDV